jgi:hypothetical protein
MLLNLRISYVGEIWEKKFCSSSLDGHAVNGISASGAGSDKPCGDELRFCGEVKTIETKSLTIETLRRENWEEKVDDLNSEGLAYYICYASGSENIVWAEWFNWATLFDNT